MPAPNEDGPCGHVLAGACIGRKMYGRKEPYNSMTARQYAMFRLVQQRRMMDEEHARLLKQRTLGSLVRNGWVYVDQDLNFGATSQGIVAADNVKDLERESYVGWSKYVWDKERGRVVSPPRAVTQMVRHVAA